MSEVLAEVTRSGVVESRHGGDAVLLNSDGSTLLSRGNPGSLIFPRSTVKVIQASAMVRNGLQLEPRLLALVAASHSGAQMHQEGALEILASVGLDETALQNATDKPLGESERREWGSKPATSLAHNCSGKHSGMLATCVINNWPTDTYLDPNHPLQIACRVELEELAGEKVSLISIDGCGAPLFMISLMGLARAIHKITISKDPIHQDAIQACRDYPEMVAGEGRLSTRLMREIPGLFIKEGAEGVEVGSLADGATFAFKIDDGSWRAFGPLVVAILAKFGVSAIEEATPIYGGESIVGSIRAIL
ncbi:MAG: asparaginase [Streptomycetaceae bacterium]|nr:MAG: asparaginase [Streptomycetaceae bacterium]